MSQEIETVIAGKKSTLADNLKLHAKSRTFRNLKMITDIFSDNRQA